MAGFLLIVQFYLMINHVSSTDNSTFVFELNKCLRNIESIPKKLSPSFDIRTIANHMEMVVYHDEKYDYYEMNWKGYCCYKAIGLQKIPFRREYEQEDCDKSYDVGTKMDNFQCAYEIKDDKNYSVMVIHSNENSQETDVYFINKETGTIEYRNFAQFSEGDLYLPHDKADDTPQFLFELNECINKLYKIPFGESPNRQIFSWKQESYIQVNIGRDYYWLDWRGSYCSRELNGEMSFSNSRPQCNNRPLSSSSDYGHFYCGYDFWEEVIDKSDYLVFYIKRRHSGADAYIENKSAGTVFFREYEQENTGAEILKRFIAEENARAAEECSKSVLKLPKYLPLTLELKVEQKYMKIFVTFRNQYNYFQLYLNSSLNYHAASRKLFSKLDHINTTENPDVKDYLTEFKCPYSVVYNKNHIIIVVQTSFLNQTEPEPQAYAYFIHRKTSVVHFQYFPKYWQCDQELPLANSRRFENGINSCINQKNLIPSNLQSNINIVRVSNHIQITMKYEGKYDYYETNHVGSACYVAQGLNEPVNRTTKVSMEQCENIRPPCHQTFECGFEVFKSRKDHYVVLSIRSDSDDPFYLFENVYVIDELTNNVEFTQYSGHEMEYEVKPILVQSTDYDKTSNPIYAAEFQECLNIRNSIPDMGIKINVTKVNHHMSILVYIDGYYDYYEFDASGNECFIAVKMAANPTRTVEEQRKCDLRRLFDSALDLSLNNIASQYLCNYEVVKNKTFTVLRIKYRDYMYEYKINRISGIVMTAETDFGFQLESLNTDAQERCELKKYMTDYEIPLEVTITDEYFGILIKYKGKYDLYVTKFDGNVHYTKMQLQEKPQLNASDYRNEMRCQIKTFFQCPLKVIETEHFVNISVKAFKYESVYVIDKLLNDVQYYKAEDNSARRNYLADVDKCIASLVDVLNTPSPFPVEVVRNVYFIEIIVTFNGTFNIYQTNDNGEFLCKETRSAKRKPLKETKSLPNPQCISCDGPSYFKCPEITTTEDENNFQIKIVVGSSEEFKLYTLKKSTGDISVEDIRETIELDNRYGSGGFSSILKSLIG